MFSIPGKWVNTEATTHAVSFGKVKLREHCESVLRSSDWSLKLHIASKSCTWGENPMRTRQMQFAAEWLQLGQTRPSNGEFYRVWWLVIVHPNSNRLFLVQC